MLTEHDIAEQTAPSSLQALCPVGVRISRVSLQFTAEATEETMQAVDRLLEEVGESQLYLLGDYVNHLYQVQGEAVARQRIQSSYAPESVRVAAWVCKQVATERRLIAPSYSHAQEVAKLTPVEQEAWLTKARDEAWSKKQLRAELRQRAAVGKGAPDQGPVDQGAARASEAFEVFRAWYQTNAAEFTPGQKAAWDTALLPLVTDYVAQQSDEDFEALYEARLAHLRN